MGKRKLLVLNGSHSEIPLIESAKKLDFHVITSGNDPSLIGHKLADEYHCTDFSDKEAILNLARRLEVDAICSSANDFGAITAAYVAEKMKLPGHDSFETSLVIHHKDRFKRFSEKHGIPTPPASSFNNEEEALNAGRQCGFPIIVKPVDLTGGKGISTVTDLQQYQSAVNKAFAVSRTGCIVVENFVHGTQHSFSSFIHDGKVKFYFSDNEFSYINPYLVSSSSAPAINIDEFSPLLVSVAELMAKKLDLEDGILHFQYLAEGNRCHILEITRRCSGDLYPAPVSLSSGLDWSAWIVKSEAGVNCSDFPSTSQSGFCGRHCIMAPRNGVLEDIIISNEIRPNINDSLMWWNRGDVISNYMVKKLGILVLEYSSPGEMEDKTSRLNELVKVNMK